MSIRTGRVRHLSVVPDLPDTDESSDGGGTKPTGRGLVNLVLRVTVDHTRPQIWRRLRVRSDLLLSELHSVLQCAVGWEDRHMHAFSLRAAGSTRRFEMAQTLDHEPRAEAASEERVRIDEVLTSPGSVLAYEYDFGDGWTHTVELEQIDSDIDDLRSVCLDGARACPPEDCGGPSHYAQDLEIAHDPADPELPALLSRWGPGFNPARFDVDAVNRKLFSLDTGRSVLAEAVATAPAVGKLFDRIRPTEVPSLMALLPRCELTVESSVDLPVAEIAMSKLTWFLRMIGEDGVALTDAGYLKPALVAAMRKELEWGLGWVRHQSARVRRTRAHSRPRGSNRADSQRAHPSPSAITPPARNLSALTPRHRCARNRQTRATSPPHTAPIRARPTNARAFAAPGIESSGLATRAPEPLGHHSTCAEPLDPHPAAQMRAESSNARTIATPHDTNPRASDKRARTCARAGGR
ncbi:plasmid pRiA4b ORF-3 family protein [Rhodococcus sp. KRD162]|uniref:plasmid pRiA4b ORF-3 family protein n=1 Tax=Rhodococcus sp. KRD162 TaxID=2729725 RepID=UPI0019D178E7|nr:plasmid pRiA4b ORF-3 family protein [Rhodococcus sp. KRD162]